MFVIVNKNKTTTVSTTVTTPTATTTATTTTTTTTIIPTATSSSTSTTTNTTAKSCITRPYTCAQLINHPYPGTLPNVYSYSFSWGEYISYIEQCRSECSVAEQQALIEKVCVDMYYVFLCSVCMYI